MRGDLCCVNVSVYQGGGAHLPITMIDGSWVYGTNFSDWGRGRRDNNRVLSSLLRLWVRKDRKIVSFLSEVYKIIYIEKTSCIIIPSEI
jgi:hypothetical protein